MKWMFLFVLCVGCYPDTTCPKPDMIEVQWSVGICPEPTRDRVRLTIDPTTVEVPCGQAGTNIDVSMRSDAVSMTVEVLSPTGQVLANTVMEVNVVPPEQTGDFQCYTYPTMIGGFPDAAPSDAGID